MLDLPQYLGAKHFFLFTFAMWLYTTNMLQALPIKN